MKLQIMSLPIEQALQITVKAKEDVLKALAGEELTTNAIFITTKYTEVVNKLSFQLGISDTQATAAPQEFPPVTRFMGEEIERTPLVTEADLQPTPTEKETYIANLDALQASFRDRKTETLITDLSGKEDLLRGLAKRAGLEDYETGTINIDYVERIKAGLDAIDTTAKEEDQINQELGFNDDVHDVPSIPAFTEDQDINTQVGEVITDAAPARKTAATKKK